MNQLTLRTSFLGSFDFRVLVILFINTIVHYEADLVALFRLESTIRAWNKKWSFPIWPHTPTLSCTCQTLCMLVWEWIRTHKSDLFVDPTEGRDSRCWIRGESRATLLEICLFLRALNEIVQIRFSTLFHATKYQLNSTNQKVCIVLHYECSLKKSLQ